MLSRIKDRTVLKLVHLIFLVCHHKASDGKLFAMVSMQVDKNFSATRLLHYNAKVVTLPKSDSGPQLYTYDGDLKLMRSRSLDDPNQGGSICTIL